MRQVALRHLVSIRSELPHGVQRALSSSSGILSSIRRTCSGCWAGAGDCLRRLGSQLGASSPSRLRSSRTEEARGGATRTATRSSAPGSVTRRHAQPLLRHLLPPSRSRWHCAPVGCHLAVHPAGIAGAQHQR